MIDAHHHIWRQKDLPWLLGPEQPRIFGAYGPIKRDYPIEEFCAEAVPEGIAGSVYVQANWAPNWTADEVAWVSAEAERTGWPMAIVGFADLTRRDAPAALDRLAKHPRMRGIRQQLHWHETPLYRFAPHPDVAADSTFRTNVARLADHGWVFDLQLFAPQFPGGAALADACPDVTFVLQHAGMLEDLSDDGIALWRAGMTALAERPNVVVKLSGLGTFLRANDPAHIGRVLAETVDIFGPERCLFGSNFPIEKIWCTYADLVAAYRAATADLSDGDREDIFAGTARRIYRL